MMEESTNPEESSNAITIQVDVHHRHYSQLSASIATTSHDCVNEPETTSDLPSIHRDYPKTAAQRMAEYRARKKKETPIVNHRKHKKSDAERAKEYRARKKAKIQSAGPAGCGKTFVIKLLMEIYNRYTDNDGYCNAYITCASTGKAAVAIAGTTVHTALKISLSRLLPLSNETAQQYRTLFKYVKVIIIDEISMISAQLLIKIDSRLKQITGNFQSNFGGLDIIFIGDLRQLPPVRATPIYKQPKQTIVGPILWRNLKFYELDQVMRQANQQFSSILTKIGNGERLDEIEISVIESRFYSVEEAVTKCPQGIRLFNTNHAVTKYNNQILNSYSEKIISTAKDVYSG
uniref:ATP-dependent DNA helicase n=1 Tax=Bombyx mori TaxID=7091 RepID=A0A8R2HPU2_BOMMO|nr:ATP-dependent DNA helicase RRM3-like isoform X4 [Bombyx mori]